MQMCIRKRYRTHTFGAMIWLINCQQNQNIRRIAQWRFYLLRNSMIFLLTQVLAYDWQVVSEEHRRITLANSTAEWNTFWSVLNPTHLILDFLNEFPIDCNSRSVHKICQKKDSGHSPTPNPGTVNDNCIAVFTYWSNFILDWSFL